MSSCKEQSIAGILFCIGHSRSYRSELPQQRQQAGDLPAFLLGLTLTHGLYVQQAQGTALLAARERKACELLAAGRKACRRASEA